MMLHLHFILNTFSFAAPDYFICAPCSALKSQQTSNAPLIIVIIIANHFVCVFITTKRNTIHSVLCVLFFSLLCDRCDPQSWNFVE